MREPGSRSVCRIHLERVLKMLGGFAIVPQCGRQHSQIAARRSEADDFYADGDRHLLVLEHKVIQGLCCLGVAETCGDLRQEREGRTSLRVEGKRETAAGELAQSLLCRLPITQIERNQCKT